MRGFRVIKVWFMAERNGPFDTCTLSIDVASSQSLKVEVDKSYTV